jgi:hypothetical protein
VVAPAIVEDVQPGATQDEVLLLVDRFITIGDLLNQTATTVGDLATHAGTTREQELFDRLCNLAEDLYAEGMRVAR